MSFIGMNTLLKHAQENKYAVGYFESWNLESMQSVVIAAENAKSPVIIGVGGSFIGNRQRKYKESLEVYAAMANTLARNASVPIATILNEADDISLVYQGIKHGFSAVMYQNEQDRYERIIQINQALVPIAHACGVSVEVEIDNLPVANIATGEQTECVYTDPDKAADFVNRTGIDALAVAVGNVHLLEDRKAQLDLDLVSRLRNRISIPLVLHGGTGADPDNIREAVHRGIAKINVGTVLKRVYLNAIQDYLKVSQIKNTDPHEIIGKGGSRDMLMYARDAMIDSILAFIRLIGSENKANMI